MLNKQHITPNSKRWDYSDIPDGGTEKIKGPTDMDDGDHYLRKDPNPHLMGPRRYGYGFMCVIFNFQSFE